MLMHALALPDLLAVAHASSDNDIPAVVVPIVAIFFTFLWLIVRTIMAPFTQRNQQRAVPPPVPGQGAASGGGGYFTAEEQAILEKLQRTLGQMESRVEALETILIEERRREKYEKL